MQFFYHKDAGAGEIVLDSKDFHYLFRVRRFNSNEILKVRNLVDKKLYFYIYNKKTSFILNNFIESSAISKNANLNLILSIIDLKDIYDILPFLNALNVASLSLFYADFSQKNREINMQKAHKILTYSCMQCGRIDLMEIRVFNNLDSIFENYKNASVIDFIDSNISNKNIENLENLEFQNIANNGIIIGAEGGFSQKEKDKIFKNSQVFSLKTTNILTSHLASVYIASLALSKG